MFFKDYLIKKIFVYFFDFYLQKIQTKGQTSYKFKNALIKS